MFKSATPKKVNSENLPPGKIYLKIETPGKKSQSRDSLDCYIHTPVRIKNGIVHFHMHSKSQFRGSGTVGITFQVPVAQLYFLPMQCTSDGHTFCSMLHVPCHFVSFCDPCDPSLGSLEDISPAQIYCADLTSVVFFFLSFVAICSLNETHFFILVSSDPILFSLSFPVF